MKKILLFLVVFPKIYCMEELGFLYEKQNSAIPTLLELSARMLPKTINQHEILDNQLDNILARIPVELAEKSIEILKSHSLDRPQLLPQNIAAISVDGTIGFKVQPTGNTSQIEAFTLKQQKNDNSNNFTDSFFLLNPESNEPLFSPDGNYVITYRKKENEFINIFKTKPQKWVAYLKTPGLKKVYMLDNSSWFCINHQYESYYVHLDKLQSINDNKFPIELKLEDFTHMNKIYPTKIKQTTIKDFFLSDLTSWLEEYPKELFSAFLDLEVKLNNNNASSALVHPTGTLIATAFKNNNQIELWDIASQEKISSKTLEQYQVKKLQWIKNGDELIAYCTNGKTLKIGLNNFKFAQLLAEQLITSLSN